MQALRPHNPDWNELDALAADGRARLDGDCVYLSSAQGDLVLSLHEQGMRLRLGETGRDYGILTAEPPCLPLTLEGDDQASVIRGGDFHLHVHHAPFRFRFYKGARLVQRSPSDAHFVRDHRLPPLAKTQEGWFIGFELNSDEPVYGLGEKWGGLNRRGDLIRSWNYDALGVNAEASYKNTPFAWSPEGWAVFAHTPYAVTHAPGYAPWSHRAYYLHQEGGALDLFIMAGDDGGALIRDYCVLTGFAKPPPEWSHGIILSRAYYKDADEVRGVARKVRDMGMPCDIITFDGRAWQDTRTRFAFEWDASRYPDPKTVIDELKALGFKICVWEYPLVSVENPLFDEMAAKGWLLKNEQGGPYRYEWDPEPFDDVLTLLPPSGLVDFTHPDAYIFWRDQHKALFDLGVDMIKADFGEQVSVDMVAHNGARGDELHNIYALLYNCCVFEAADRYGPHGAFVFNRCGWAGSQRYPAHWGGDPQADWEGLSASIRGALSWGLSGGPFYATDIGGFYGDSRDEALYVRWLQAGLFASHFRLHGIGPREPWSYGEKAEAIAMDILKLRKKLEPYIRKTSLRACETGLPVQRPMILSCPGEPQSWGFENQFMCGDDILFAPCLRPDGRVRFYLPEGTWRHLLGGEVYEGGRSYTQTFALHEMAAFVADGAIVF